MTSYKPHFKETAIRSGGWPDKAVTINGVRFTFRAIYRLKSDAEEAKKFYKSIHSQVRVMKKADGYWVFAGRPSSGSGWARYS